MSEPARARGDGERGLMGRHAVVTGGGKGIGAAIAEELARLGANVTVMGRDTGALEAHAGALCERYGGRHAGIRCDVTDEADVARAFREARESAGDPSILVNNAGAATSARFGETSLAAWNALLAVNLTSAFLCAQQCLAAMLAAGSGRIVNIGSTASLKGASRLTGYTAAKHGLLGLTRALAAETAKKGVTVNAVCPGYTDTDMARGAVDNLTRGLGVSEAQARQMIVNTVPRGRLIEPREVASAVGWLCSDGASGVTGQAIVIAGGEP